MGSFTSGWPNHATQVRLSNTAVNSAADDCDVSVCAAYYFAYVCVVYPLLANCFPMCRFLWGLESPKWDPRRCLDTCMPTVRGALAYKHACDCTCAVCAPFALKHWLLLRCQGHTKAVTCLAISRDCATQHDPLRYICLKKVKYHSARTKKDTHADILPS